LYEKTIKVIILLWITQQKNLGQISRKSELQKT
jgi:hypothetical protein